MATVASFYSHLNGESGILGKHGAQVLFFSYETGSITEVTSYAGLTVLGQADVADTQRVMDVMVHGGYAQVCTSRAMETR